MDAYIREGLASMGATAHLELFNRTVAVFDALSEEDEERYLDGDLDARGRGAPPRPCAPWKSSTASSRNCFETENITALNAAWLLGQESLLVLDDEELSAHIDERVALSRPRRAPGPTPTRKRWTTPRSLRSSSANCATWPATRCEKITMGDPNYVHNGEKTLAWHFSTDHGDFLMVEDEDEAFMINPETKEIVAAVEFEEADG